MISTKQKVFETIKSNPNHNIEELCFWVKIDEAEMVKHLFEYLQEGKVVFEKRKGWKVK